VREPVAIVAAGAVTPIGRDVDTFWTSLLTGVSGITGIERFPVRDLRVQRGGEIKKLPTSRGARLRTECRASRLLVGAAGELRASAAALLETDPARLAVVVGTALGGVEEGERALAGVGTRAAVQPAPPPDRISTARAYASGLYDTPARNLAGWLGARGPVLTVSTACASGATALGVGAELLRAGAADLVIAGGYDVLCSFVMRGFDALRSLTREHVRPFDRRRSGILLGEGAALVLLARERDADARGASRLGRLLGHGSASDGSHISAPDPNGRGLEYAIRRAMDEAGVAAAAIDFVSAHGTATPLNDRVETVVLKRILGRRAYEVPVNGIKSYMGHTMGAAATLEAIMCLLASRHGAVPATLGLEEPDPECDLDYVPGAARALRPRLMLSTSLGFGGCNAALVLEGA
jgi:3-oxoacyl-[acyl-carrier-protein] synthase II